MHSAEPSGELRNGANQSDLVPATFGAALVIEIALL